MGLLSHLGLQRRRPITEDYSDLQVVRTVIVLIDSQGALELSSGFLMLTLGCGQKTRKYVGASETLFTVTRGGGGAINGGPYEMPDKQSLSCILWKAPT